MNTPASDDVSLIREQRGRSNAAIVARDVEGIVAVMMPDVMVAVAGGPRLSGRDASRSAFADQFADRTFAGYVRSATDITVADSRMHATERGQWTGTWRSKSGEHVMRGAYIAEWRRTDGGWLIQSEAFVEKRR